MRGDEDEMLIFYVRLKGLGGRLRLRLGGRVREIECLLGKEGVTE